MIQGEQVLVLNKSWVAIATTTVKRAMSLVFRHHARIVDPDSFEVLDWDRWVSERSLPIDGLVVPEVGYIHTVSLRIPQPYVITLATYGGVPSLHVPYSRRALFRRDNNTCQYCGVVPGTKRLTIDHVMPRSRGGGTDWLNCVVACMRCNIRKGNRTPEECGQALRRPPFRPSFVDGLFEGEDVPERWRSFVRNTSRMA